MIHLDIPIKKNLSGSNDRVLRPLYKTSLPDHLRRGSVVHAENLIGKSYKLLYTSDNKLCTTWRSSPTAK